MKTAALYHIPLIVMGGPLVAHLDIARVVVQFFFFFNFALFLTLYFKCDLYQSPDVTRVCTYK